MTASNSTSAHRRDYPNPPVHEVILDIQCQDALPDQRLKEIAEDLSGEFGTPTRANATTVQMSFASGGAESVRSDTAFAGWVFQESDPDWVLRALRNRVTLHAPRKGDWPHGDYRGWEKIFARFQTAHELLAESYKGLNPRRVGLRYQNRIAVPQGSDLSKWFTLLLQAPEELQDIFSFNLKQTWARLAGDEDLSANVNLARIEIGDPDVAEENVGVMLDIDVFNLWVKNAPTFPDTPEWFKRAHEAENRIFEGCITDALRQQFY